MKIEICIENEDDKKSSEEVELTPEQIAEMASKLKSKKTLSREDRVMLAKYLMQEKED